MKETIKLFFIGDIIGVPGYNLTKTLLPSFVTKYKPDFIIANGENITGGIGMIESDAEKLLALGINVLTGGNHTMDKIQAHKYIHENPNVLRPLNYPKGVYGRGFGLYEIPGTGLKICIASIIGRVFMRPLDCPFRAFDWLHKTVSTETNLIFVDFHAEATAEKIAFGWHADGRASVVVGTHTHVQTSDNRVLPEGTGYITDVGMTGPYESVIGMNRERSVKRFIFGTPQKHDPGENDVRLAGVIAEIITETGKCKSIHRIMYPEF